MIMSNNTPIKCIGTVVTGKTPSTNIAENFGDEYMFVTPAELHDIFIIEKSDKMLTQKGLDSIRSNAIQGLSILVGCIGWDMGNVALVEERCATNQQINSITKIKEAYNPYYVYYWLLTQKKNLFKRATITRTPILNKTTFEEILVPTPDKSVQDDIANLLLPISKKIQLNNSIIAELEKVAKTLYNYWFMQFDFPNAKGQPYRTSGGKMEYNEVLKRKIPIGWKVIPFSEILSENKQPLPEDTKKDDMFGLDLSIMPSASMCLNQRGKASDFESNRFILKKYDLLFGSIRPYLRKAGFAVFDGVVNGTIMNFRCKGNTDYSYALCTLTSEMMFKYAITRSSGNGTRMPTINATELLDYVIVYDKQTVIQFENHLSQYWKMIADNINQNFELTELRDFLLPLLMNGQAKVKEESTHREKSTKN